MPRISIASTPRRFVAALFTLSLAVPAAAGAPSSAWAAGRPAATVDPPQDCSFKGAWWRGNAALLDIDICRAQEGVGPLMLPRNWRVLSAAGQMLVLIDLERVNRGLKPVTGLSPVVNRVAQAGADAGADPSTPPGRLRNMGSLWSSTSTALQADLAWMYEDGTPTGNDIVNLDCKSASSPGCWGHRRVILTRNSGMVGGGAVAHANGRDSYAFENVSGRGAQLTFTWAQELKAFTQRPVYEPLGRPILTAASFDARPASGSRSRRHRVELTGHNLLSVKRFMFGSTTATAVSCLSETVCKMTVSVAPRGAVVTAVGWGGLAKLSL